MEDSTKDFLKNVATFVGGAIVLGAAAFADANETASRMQIQAEKEEAEKNITGFGIVDIYNNLIDFSLSETEANRIAHQRFGSKVVPMSQFEYNRRGGSRDEMGWALVSSTGYLHMFSTSKELLEAKNWSDRYKLIAISRSEYDRQKSL